MPREAAEDSVPTELLSLCDTSRLKTILTPFVSSLHQQLHQLSATTKEDATVVAAAKSGATSVLNDDESGSGSALRSAVASMQQLLKDFVQDCYVNEQSQQAPTTRIQSTADNSDAPTDMEQSSAKAAVTVGSGALPSTPDPGFENSNSNQSRIKELEDRIANMQEVVSAATRNAEQWRTKCLAVINVTMKAHKTLHVLYKSVYSHLGWKFVKDPPADVAPEKIWAGTANEPVDETAIKALMDDVDKLQSLVKYVLSPKAFPFRHAPTAEIDPDTHEEAPSVPQMRPVPTPIPLMKKTTAQMVKDPTASQMYVPNQATVNSIDAIRVLKAHLQAEASNSRPQMTIQSIFAGMTTGNTSYTTKPLQKGTGTGGSCMRPRPNSADVWRGAASGRGAANRDVVGSGLAVRKGRPQSGKPRAAASSIAPFAERASRSSY